MKFSMTIPLQYDTGFSPFPARDAVRGLDWARQNNLDGVELCISHYKNLDLGVVCDLLAERGLECSTISTGQARGLEGLSLIEGAPETQHQTVERMLQHIDAAKRLGSKVTIGLLRGTSSPAEATAARKKLREAMLPLAEYADKQGVMLCLEAINRYETTLLNNVQETLDFIRQDLSNPDCVGILWDLFHANIEDADWQRSVNAMGAKLQHLHLADSDRSFPGFGHIDFEAILTYIKDTGYQGYCSFECLNRPERQTVLERTGPWVQAMRRL